MFEKLREEFNHIDIERDDFGRKDRFDAKVVWKCEKSIPQSASTQP